MSDKRSHPRGELPPSRYLRHMAGRLLRLLQGSPRSKVEIQARLGCSRPTIARAITWLRGCDVPLEWDRASNLYTVGYVEDLGAWTLQDLIDTQTIDPGEAQALATLAACSMKRKPK